MREASTLITTTYSALGYVIKEEMKRLAERGRLAVSVAMTGNDTEKMAVIFHDGPEPVN